MKKPLLACALVHKDAVLPSYSSEKAACFDLRAMLPEGVESVEIPAGKSHAFKTGLRCSIPEGYRLAVQGRSGHWFKHGIRLGNNEGVIDNDFTGEIGVSLHNTSDVAFVVKHKDRIAQAEIREYVQAAFCEISEDELPNTERGTGGFGSTGTK